MKLLSRTNTTRLGMVVGIIMSHFLVFGQNSETELRLRKDLFSNHSNVIRPVANMGMPVEINATLELLKINNFDTVNGVLVSQCSLELSWYDELLSWDPAKYANISVIYVSAKKIWRPNIIVCNSASAQFIDIGVDNVELHSDGRLVLGYQEILRTFCKIDALSYPFDKQHCRILIGVAVLELKHLIIKQLHYHKASFFRNFEWNVEMKGIGKPLDNSGRSMTKATIYFSRKIKITTIASLVPAAIFTVVSVFVFLLPIDSGEKMTLSTTLLLSKIVYLVQIDKVTPRNSQSMPLLTVYILILTIWSGFNTIGTVLESRLYFSKKMKAEEKNHPVENDDKRAKGASKKKIDIEQDNDNNVQKKDSGLISGKECRENNDVTCEQHDTRNQQISKIFLGIGVVYIVISIMAICLKAFVKEY